MPDDAVELPIVTDKGTPEPDPSVGKYDQLKMALFQEAQRCMQGNDRIIEIGAKDQEILDVAKEIKAALGDYGPFIFPPDVAMCINPEQEQPLMYRRMSDEENSMLSIYVKEFVGFINRPGGLADKWKLPRIKVYGPSGAEFEWVPFVYDSGTMRQAVFNEMVRQFEATRSSRVLQLPDAALLPG